MVHLSSKELVPYKFKRHCMINPGTDGNLNIMNIERVQAQNFVLTRRPKTVGQKSQRQHFRKNLKDFLKGFF